MLQKIWSILIVSTFLVIKVSSVPFFQIPSAITFRHQNNPDDVRFEFETKNRDGMYQETPYNPMDNRILRFNNDNEQNMMKIETRVPRILPRAKRTMGRIYCTMFYMSNPSECPIPVTPGIMSRIPFVRNLFATPTPPTTPVPLRRQQPVFVSDQKRNENEFWLNYFANNNNNQLSTENSSDAQVSASSVQDTTYVTEPSSSTTIIPNSGNMLGMVERRPFGWRFRGMFPRLSRMILGNPPGTSNNNMNEEMNNNNQIQQNDGFSLNRLRLFGPNSMFRNENNANAMGHFISGTQQFLRAINPIRIFRTMTNAFNPDNNNRDNTPINNNNQLM